MKYPKQENINALKEEINRARNKHPSNTHLLAALTEEVGELNKAYLEGDYEHAKTEAIQVACVALRILEEGDSDFIKEKEIKEEIKEDVNKIVYDFVSINQPISIPKIKACFGKEYDVENIVQNLITKNYLALDLNMKLRTNLLVKQYR